MTLRRLPTFTISFPYNHMVQTQNLKNAVFKIIKKSKLSENIKEHIKLQLRIVNTRHRNIAETLSNTTRACEQYDPNNEPKCIKDRQ